LSEKTLYRVTVAVIFMGYFFLAWSYAQGPLFEPWDEDLHYDYVRVMADERIFPNPYTKDWSEYLQPPAYYMLLAPVLVLLPDRDFDEYQTRDWKNPYYGEFIGIAEQQNRNLWLHSRSENFPYRGNNTARNVQILRLTSILIGSITLLLCHQIFLILWPGHPYWRLFALSVAAFWPLFLRMSAAVNNDNLVYLLSTASVYLMLRMARDGPSWRLSALLGIVFGLALSTKTSTVALALPMGLVALTDRRTWRYMPLISLLTAVFGGWWYLRNTLVYESAFFYDHPQIESYWVDETHRFVLDHALQSLPVIFERLWAHYNSIVVYPVLYTGFYAVILLALLGCAIRFIHTVYVGSRSVIYRQAFRQWLVMTGLVAGWFLMVFYVAGVITVGGAQGRYILSAIAGMAALIAVGLESWIPERFKKRFALSGIAFLMALATVIYAGYFRLAFLVLPAPDEIEHPVSYRYDDVAELIGVNSTSFGGAPGDIVKIELYWRALHPASSSTLVVSVTAFGSETLRKHSYPAGGNLLATDWRPGETWMERYFQKIPADAERQKTYPLVIGLYDLATTHRAAAVDAAGHEVFPVVGRFTVHGDPADRPAYRYRLGDRIGLNTTAVTRNGDRLEVCLEWVSRKATGLDYHYFLHVYEGDRFITQLDGQPRNGDYPTSSWLPGEIVRDYVEIDAPGLASDGWSVKVGLYDLATGERLPVQDQDGSLLENRWISLAPDAS
jgi:hypothetical protein